VARGVINGGGAAHAIVGPGDTPGGAALISSHGIMARSTDEYGAAASCGGPLNFFVE